MIQKRRILGCMLRCGVYPDTAVLVDGWLIEPRTDRYPGSMDEARVAKHGAQCGDQDVVIHWDSHEHAF